MKLSTNYSQTDWYRCLVYVFIVGIIPAVFLLIMVIVFYLPLVELYFDFMDYRLAEIDITEFRDIALNLGYSFGQIIVFYILLFSAIVVFPIWVIFWMYGEISSVD